MWHWNVGPTRLLFRSKEELLLKFLHWKNCYFQCDGTLDWYVFVSIAKFDDRCCPVAMLVPLGRASTRRLHTKLYKFGWNTLPNNARMKNLTDLNLSEVVNVSITYHVPDSWVFIFDCVTVQTENILSRSKFVCKLCIFSNVDRLLLLFTGSAKTYYGELDMIVIPPGSKDVIGESKSGVMPNSNWRYLCIMSLAQYHSELLPLRNGGRLCHC